ncbi:TPA: fimbria/pilus outer membrane usher protein [Enterobacter ludwigii]
MATLRKKKCAALVFMVLFGYSNYGLTRDHFNAALLENNLPSMKDIDLSSFEEGMQQSGKYRVDIILNNEYIDSRDIDFTATKNHEDNLYPCISMDLLRKMNVKVDNFPELKEHEGCTNFEIIPQASANYDLASQQLQLSIPQAALSPVARGYVDPALWDEGMTAFLINYSLTGDETRSRAGENTQSQYANLRPGLNIGSWRFRNYTTWSHSSAGDNKLDSVYTYAQRDIISLKSRLTLGDSSAPSDIFESVPFRGIQLASDEDMMPDSLRGYAPVVRGIAKTNAQVIIHQNGYTIYQSYVPAGAFEIKDLYSSGGSGDLNVTVKEQDGSTQQFIVPYASLPLLQREGNLKYSATGGQYRSYNANVQNTSFVQATAIYGLPFGITLFGGAQFAAPYKSTALGIGKNFGNFGAVSADMISARSQIANGDTESGRSFRIRYSKNFIETGTNFSIAGYRYSTKGFYSMPEIMESYGNDDALSDRRRNRAELTLTQSLGERLGSLTASAVKEKYWNKSTTMQSYSVSYNNSYKSIGYSLSYSYNKNTSSDNGSDSNYNDKLLMVNLNIPFGRFLPGAYASYSLNNSKQGGTSQSVNLSGTALQGDNLGWNIQQSKDRTGYSGGVNMDYHGALAQISSGYNYSPTSQQINYGVSGGVVIHGGGVTLSQPLGETVAIVEAKNAKGTGINNQTGVKIDGFGYAVMNNLTPYHQNSFALDTSTSGDDVEIEDNGITVVPTKGAVVSAKFVSHTGYKALITLKTSSGYVPFGAMANLVNATEGRSFIVGDTGQVYISGIEKKEGVLHVKWGDDPHQNCASHYTLPVNPVAGGIYMISSLCE